MTSRLSFRLAHLAALPMAVALPLAAQTAAPATPSEPKEEVLMLSPFQVTSEGDIGYAANDTLAGSRMRTSLSDVPNAITVFTSEFMNDLLAFNETDVLRYSASAIPERSDQTPNVQGIDINAGFFQARIRGQKATRSRNYFETSLLPDTYNIDRFEEARGPNAILFGLGGAGGLLNSTTKQARLNRTSTEINALVGSWNQLRATIDHNQMLTKQLAIRINGVLETSDGWHANEAPKDNRRIAGALTFRPIPKLTVRLEGEMGETTDSVTRSFTPADFVSIWAENGRTLLPSATQAPTAAQIAAGIGRRNNDRRVTFIGNDGSVKNFQQTLLTQHTVATGRNRTSLLPEGWNNIDASPYPFYEASFFGPGGYVNNKQGSYTGAIEVEPVKNLFLEAIYNHDHRTQYFYDQNDNVMQVRADPAQTYRDGTPNPYAGQYYVDTFNVLRYQKIESDRWRLTAAYLLDLGKFGRHNFAALKSHDETDNPRHTAWLSLLTGAPGTNAGVQNHVWLRSYVSDPSNPASWSVPDWRTVPSQLTLPLSAGATPTTYDVGWDTEGGTFVFSSNDSTMGTLQSYWLKDKVVTTYGYRKVDYAQSRGDSVDSGSVSRKSYGVVAKPTSWVSLYYNYSENAVIPTATQTLLPDEGLFPINSGEGKDYGLMFSLLDRRVFVRAGYFKTTSADQANASALGVNVRQPHERITEALVTAGLVPVSAVPVWNGGDFDLSDVVTDGYELNITANLTDNWSLIFSGTKSDSISSNLLKISRTLITGNLPLWQTPGGASLLTTNGITVTDEITNVMAWRDSVLSLEGDSTIGHRPEQGRFFTRYNFTQGRLKGFFVGGGLTYSSKATIGKLLDNTYLTSAAYWDADAVIGYRMKLGTFLGKKGNLTLQLNGQNLLQDGRISLLRADTDGQLYRGIVNPPRRYLLNARLNF